MCVRTVFTETMLGTVRLDADPRERRIRLDLRAEAEEMLRPHRTTRARLTGRVRITGVADAPCEEGELEISPLAREHRSKAGLVERWEAFAGGMEIANAFSELVDPDAQRERFEAQSRLQAQGDEDAQPYDEVFIQALEQGMPPAGGVGLGIDRVAMLLTGRDSIREVVLFPAMREP